jgi:VWFA-related protein
LVKSQTTEAKDSARFCNLSHLREDIVIRPLHESHREIMSEVKLQGDIAPQPFCHLPRYFVLALLLAGCGDSEQGNRPGDDRTNRGESLNTPAQSDQDDQARNTTDGLPEAVPTADQNSAPVTAESEPALSTRFRFEFDDGELQGVLSSQRKTGTELPTAEIAEGTPELWLHVRSGRIKGTRLYVSLQADDVFGLDPEVRLYSDFKLLLKDEGWRLRLRLPMSGQAVGRYRLNLAIENGPEQDLFFLISSDVPAAQRVEDMLPPAGYNIAARALGGKLQSFSAQVNDSNWQAANLIDGFAQIYDRRGRQPSSGWLAAMTEKAPPELVFSFFENRIARVEAVAFDLTRTVADTDDMRTGARSSEIPRHIEIWVAQGDDPGEFNRVAAARIHNIVGRQWIGFEPVDAKYLKVRVLNNYGDQRVALAEVMVIEAATQQESILAGREIDLASPALGGALVGLTSQDPEFPAAGLFRVDGSTESGWRSFGTAMRAADYLPQDFLFSFSGDRVAYIDYLEIEPVGSAAGANAGVDQQWVKSVAVSIGGSDLRDGVEEIARIEVPPIAQPLKIPVGRDARYVRLRVLKNHGGKRTAIGKIRIVEGSRPGYSSLIHDHTRITAAGPRVTLRQAAAPPAPDGNEPNDTPADATPYMLGARVAGNLHNLADRDYFRLSVPGDEVQAVSFDVTGSPDIRTAMTLLSNQSKTRKSFLPRSNIGTATRFTWQVSPGDYLLRLTRPPLSIVVVWDTSGSMEGRTDALGSAVRQFLGGIEAGEKIQLIRFSDRAKTLLDEFTSEKTVIEETLRGQFSPLGATALIDALVAADALLSSMPGRRVIVAFTDGQDTASRAAEGDFWARLSNGPTQIYTIGLGNDLANYSHRTGSTGHQFLNAMAILTNGRYFYARNTDDLAPIFETIAAELRALPDFTFSASASAKPGALQVISVGERIPALSPPKFELVLDASGSMKRKVADGRTRMDIAKEVLQDIVKEIPEGVEVALRVFGHRVTEGQPGDCADTELLVAMGPVNKTVLARKIESIRALGTTLIAHTLEQLAGDFAGTGDDQFVVLVTDGEEECRDDLLKTVRRLKDSGLNMNLSIVGFAIGNEEITSRLEDVALAGGGVFVQARAAVELRQALDVALAARFSVHDQDGGVVAAGTVNGGPLSVAEGVYDISVQGATEEILISDVTVSADESVTVELDRQGQQVGIQIRANDDER